jgi:hypothetical protein
MTAARRQRRLKMSNNIVIWKITGGCGGLTSLAIFEVRWRIGEFSGDHRHAARNSPGLRPACRPTYSRIYIQPRSFL